MHLVFNLFLRVIVPPRLQTRHGSVCFKGIHNDVTDRKRLEKAWHLLELARSPLAQQKRCNNKQAIRRQRERTQRHCKTLQIIKADFSLEGMIICVLQLSINRGPLTGSINIQMEWRAVVVQRNDFKHSCLCSIKMEYIYN